MASDTAPVSTSEQQPADRVPEAAVGSPERLVAMATIAAPAGITALTPMLDPGATFAAALATGGYLTIAASAYTQQISARLLEMTPGGDILHGHRSTLMLSSALTASGLAAGIIGGAQGSVELLAGFLTVPSPAGLASLAWWGAVGVLPLKLRRVLRSTRSARERKPGPAAGGARRPVGMGPREYHILSTWAQYAADGTAKGHVMTVTALLADRWEAVVTAPRGKPVQVKEDAVSALYEMPLDQVEVLPGAHAGECRVIVHARPRTAAIDQTPSGIKGLWEVRVARAGVLPHSYIDRVEVKGDITGLVVKATEDSSALAHPNVYHLAGALRTRPSLLTYTPTANPRVGQVLLMERNPLQDKRPVKSATEVAMSPSGRMALGMMATGRKAYLQLLDRTLGALHVAVVGTTGAGKGGVIQLICLGAHAAGTAIIYADPKGSSNPAVEDMAAYSGTGPDGALRALRVANAVLDHRIEESRATKEKNFTPRPDRPHVLVVVDEAPESVPDGSEGAIIASRIARLGRSVGISLLLASQTMLAEHVAGSETRQQIINGGTLIFLRVAKEVVSLAGSIPEKFKTVDPSQIPISWSEDQDDEQLFYDEDQDIPEAERTYGLGYIADHQAAPSMFRAADLEDARPFLGGIAITHPEDVPWWRDEAALTVIESTIVKKRKAAASSGATGDGDGDWDGDGDGGFELTVLTKEPTAKEKIIKGLRWLHSEMGSPTEGFAVKEIEVASGVRGQTLQNVLGDLVKDGAAARIKKGHYALTQDDGDAEQD